MARGATLESLRADLKFELSDAAGASLAKQAEPLYDYRLRRVQEWLWQDYDWPFLRVRRDVQMQAGQRYYDAPADLPFERIERTRFRWGDVWIPVNFGISSELFTSFDSARDVRSDPPQRWDYYTDADANDDVARIEVWPIPATTAIQVEDPENPGSYRKGQQGTLRFRGIRRLRPLVADNDRCDLDDHLIVLYAAARILAKRSQKDAEAVQNMAASHYARLKSRVKGPQDADRVPVLGGEGYDEPHYTDYMGIPRIPTGHEHESF